MRKKILTAFLFICSSAIVAQEKLDDEMVRKIRNEGLNNSKVMDIALQLTDIAGPRLMNSPGYLRAANWAKSTLTQWGLEGARLESWGDWGKGWELQHSYIAMTAPYYRPMIAFPKSWVSGTNGSKTAELLIVDAKDSYELSNLKGKLKGKVLILPRTDTLVPGFQPDAVRYTDQQLKMMADYDPNRPAPAGPPSQLRPGSSSSTLATQVLNKLKELAKAEGAVAILSTGSRGKDGTMFVSGGGQYAGNNTENFLDIILAYEDYMSLYRLAKAGQTVKLEVNVKTKFSTGDLKGYNVVAEMKGTDSKLKEEIVMLGAHLDSWHSATGATDNAAGCAVMMEVVRILKTLNVKPRRTIRIALWGGEEQGLHGSKNYVRNHFTDTVTKKFNREGDKVAGYFNLDNGTGKVRGIYLQNNAAVKPIFAKWLEPFTDLGATTVTLQNTGGTDHRSFDAIGLPAFQFIQDPIEYDTRTHHTNMDSYDHLLSADLKQAATVIASFVYHTAQREEKLPRKSADEQARSRGF